MEIILFALFFAQKAPNFLCQMWNILQRMISRENNRFSVELSRSYFCTALPYQHVDQKIDFHRGFSRLSLDHIGAFQLQIIASIRERLLQFEPRGVGPNSSARVASGGRS